MLTDFFLASSFSFLTDSYTEESTQKKSLTFKNTPSVSSETTLVSEVSMQRTFSQTMRAPEPLPRTADDSSAGDVSPRSRNSQVCHVQPLPRNSIATEPIYESGEAYVEATSPVKVVKFELPMLPGNGSDDTAKHEYLLVNGSPAPRKGNVYSYSEHGPRLPGTGPHAETLYTQPNSSPSANSAPTSDRSTQNDYLCPVDSNPSSQASSTVVTTPPPQTSGAVVDMTDAYQEPFDTLLRSQSTSSSTQPVVIQSEANSESTYVQPLEAQEYSLPLDSVRPVSLGDGRVPPVPSPRRKASH